MIDSHCHLADPKFAPDLPAVIDRAGKAGVDRIICIADSMEEAEKCIAIAGEYEQIFCTVGVHPHVSDRWSDVSGQKVRDALKRSKCRAVGEIGLDYHYMHSPKDTQQRVFEAQLRIAKEEHIPAVIHCREAIDDVWTMVREIGAENLVLHCCTEKWQDVKQFLDRGCFLSFTGIATYPHAADIRETIRECPLMQMMIETDAPYLAPVPHRGQRNEPAYVIEVAKLIAELKGIDLAEVDAVTTRNAVEFFRLPS